MIDQWDELLSDWAGAQLDEWSTEALLELIKLAEVELTERSLEGTLADI